MDVTLLASHRQDQLILRLVREKRPFVLIGRYKGSEDIYWVNNNNVLDAKQAVEHLLDKGHRQIACLDGDPWYVVSVDWFLLQMLIAQIYGSSMNSDHQVLSASLVVRDSA